MTVGIVSYWFNRGQDTVGRQIRSIFQASGMPTQVLARPTKDSFTYSNFVSGQDLWDQPGVTRASQFDIPKAEYLEWAVTNNIEVAFFDQNYQFDEISALRAAGVRTIGRFVWEDFAAEHVRPAQQAFDVIYSLTRCEQARYHALGVDTLYVRWGCHPELETFRQQRVNEGKSFLYIGGFLSHRKPTLAAIRAFRELRDPVATLNLKTQRQLKDSDLIVPTTMADLSRRPKFATSALAEIEQDKRISVCTDDLTSAAYFRLFASSDVSLAPSRWEGLGLHLFEAQSLGIPTISCDIQPINEIIVHGVNGLLVRCTRIGERRNGLPAFEPDADSFAAAVRAISDPGMAQALAAGTAEIRVSRSWDLTCRDYLELVAS